MLKNDNGRPIWLAGILLISLTAGITPPAESEVPDGIVKIRVKSGRPLAAAADEIQSRIGIVVNYEDPPYTHESDLREMIIPTSGAKVMVPAGGTLELKYVLPLKATRAREMTPLLGSLLDAYAASHQPGGFRVEQAGEMFHIIPTEVKNKEGILVPVTPILDTPIDLPEIERSGAEILVAITERVSAETGQVVMVGLAPINLFMRHRVRIGGTGVAARECLVQLLEALDAPVSWRLFYDPGLGFYVLNIVTVSPRTAGVTTKD